MNLTIVDNIKYTSINEADNEADIICISDFVFHYFTCKV